MIGLASSIWQEREASIAVASEGTRCILTLLFTSSVVLATLVDVPTSDAIIAKLLSGTAGTNSVSAVASTDLLASTVILGAWVSSSSEATLPVPSQGKATCAAAQDLEAVLSTVMVASAIVKAASLEASLTKTSLAKTSLTRASLSRATLTRAALTRATSAGTGPLVWLKSPLSATAGEGTWCVVADLAAAPVVALLALIDVLASPFVLTQEVAIVAEAPHLTSHDLTIVLTVTVVVTTTRRCNGDPNTAILAGDLYWNAANIDVS